MSKESSNTLSVGVGIEVEAGFFAGKVTGSMSLGYEYS